MIRRIAREAREREPQRIGLVPVPADAPAPAREHVDRRAALARLLHDELTLAPERVVRLCARELARYGAATVAVRAHPSDCALLARALGGGPALTWVEDASLTRGGCVLVGDSGEIDARIETRIERMIAVLEEER